jgi:hypothetical protein
LLREGGSLDFEVSGTGLLCRWFPRTRRDSEFRAVLDHLKAFRDRILNGDPVEKHPSLEEPWAETTPKDQRVLHRRIEALIGQWPLATTFRAGVEPLAGHSARTGVYAPGFFSCPTHVRPRLCLRLVEGIVGPLRVLIGARQFSVLQGWGRRGRSAGGAPSEGSAPLVAAVPELNDWSTREA